MSKRCFNPEDFDALREKIIGLGVTSVKKSYYPKLLQNLQELARFKTLLDQSNDLIFLVEVPSGAFVDFNETACRRLAYSREQLLARSLKNVAEPTAMSAVAELIERERAGDKDRTMLETTLIGSSGERIPVEISIRIVTLGGSTYAVAAARDITERKRAEKAFRQLSYQNKLILESAGQGIFGLNLKGFVIFINRTAAAMLGYEEHELVGQHSHSKWHHSRPDGTPYPAEECPIYASYKDGTNHFGEEVFWKKDGTMLPVDFTSRPLREDGMIMGVVVTCQDITERKQAEEALRRARDELEQRVRERTAQLTTVNEALARSNDELREFVFIASHDLQEPLRKVRIFGDLIQKRCEAALDEQGSDYLARMQKSTARMQDLLGALLDFSLLATRAQPMREVELSRLAGEAAADLEQEIFRTKARIEVDALPRIEADAPQMRQLFHHLIHNAIKFRRPDAPPVIRISAAVVQEPEAPEKRYCQIAVQDNGIGFDEKYAERIFAPFQRLHDRESYEGIGAGLSICKKIVTRHGGTIVARSTPGQGTRILVSLPVKQEKGADSGDGQS